MDASPDCTDSCQSSVHGSLVTGALTQSVTDEQIGAYLRNLCLNYGRSKDGYGRSVLHVASSRNRWKLIEWLLKNKRSSSEEVLNGRDYESGWTPLHRAFFYGQLNAAKVLIEYGANLSVLDDDSLTPFDILMKDRPLYVDYLSCGLYDVYVWGINDNYNLGFSVIHSRETPEVASFFQKENLSIEQVVVRKFHTVFLSTDGQVFSCGHGQGGRLGHQKEMTAITPLKVESKEFCIRLAAGTDHTIFLMQSGSVWSCGLNKYHQLGLNPPPKQCLGLKMIEPNLFKGYSILGVCAANFHSVIYSNDGIFTFGANVGQLGHPERGVLLQTVPKLVFALKKLDVCFTHVVASDGATVCATESGDIYTLHEYQCRKIASKQRNIAQIEALGGHLNLKRDNETLKPPESSELRIVVLLKCGRIFTWSESFPHLTRCLFSLDRFFRVLNFALFRDEIIFATEDGEGFVGSFESPKIVNRSSETGHGRSQKYSSWLEIDECFRINVKRLPNIHRATKVACDPKGSNFAVIQGHPEIGMLDIPTLSKSEMSRQLKDLLSEADCYDDLHDVVLKVGNREFAAHCFILASQSNKFRRDILKSVNKSSRTESLVLDYSNINPDIFDQVLKFLYAGTCDLLIDGREFQSPHLDREVLQSSSTLINQQPDLVVCTLGSKAATYRTPSGKKKTGGKSPSVKMSRSGSDPVSFLQNAATELDIPMLTKMLNCVDFVDGKVSIVDYFPKYDMKFDRMNLSELSDVTIVARNGREIKCHKCVLVARSEYFRGMFSSRWMESSSYVNFPLPMDVLEIIVDFLYTNDSSALRSFKDAEAVLKVLVAADSLLLDRLRELCELVLAKLLTLRNVCDLVELSYIYSSEKLRSSCVNFICLNLAALFESNGGNLLAQSDDTWELMTKTYREMIPRMSNRVMTRCSKFPDTETFPEVDTLLPLDSLEDTIPSDHVEAVKIARSKRKQQKRRSTNSFSEDSRDGRCRNDSARSVETVTIEQVVTSTSAVSSPIIVPNKNRNSQSSIGTPSLPDTTVSTPKQVMLGGNEFMDDAFPDLLNELQEGSSSLKRSENESLSTGLVDKQRPHVKVDRPSPRSSKSSRRKWVSLDIALSTPPLPSPPPVSPSKNIEKVVKLPAWSRHDENEQPSLKEIMQAERASVVKSRPMPTLAKVVKEKSTPSSFPRVSLGSRRTWNVSESSSLGDVASSSNDSNIVPCFTDILRMQVEQMNALKRMNTKQLHFIQMEDKAMYELTEFYRRRADNEENILVERVLPKFAATPIWKPSK